MTPRSTLIGLAGLAPVAKAPDLGPPQPVRIGLATQPQDALAILADRLGFWAAEGLTAEVKTYPSGARAVDEGLHRGEVDLASSGDIPLASAALAGRPLRILAQTFSTTNVNRIVARRDRGIASLADLRGKRVGTQPDSSVHYFLHLVLLEEGIPESAINLRLLKAEELVPALVAGEIDAFSMREPSVSQARDAIGEQALVLEAPGLYVQSAFLVADGAWLAAHRETATRALRALARAQTWVRVRPEAARAELAQALGIEPKDLDWGNLHLGLTLPQSMLPALEGQATWLARGLDSAPPLPDFLDLIAPRPLEAVQPAAVTYVH